MRTHCALAILGFMLLCGCAGTAGLTISTTAPDGAQEQIPASLSKPEGNGPFPAVVMLHDCSGLGMSSSGAPGRWAKELVGRGYVVLVPDSFVTRGFGGGVCTDSSPKRLDVGPMRRVRDAYAALAYLRTLPFVDARHIGVMGGSHGGLTTLAAMAAPASDADPLAQSKREGFAAAVALYPGCNGPRIGSWRASSGEAYRPVAPVLILVGEKDDWTPAEPCSKLARASQAAGYPVSLKIYPGAYHSFDSYNPVFYNTMRVNANSPTGFGATTGGNAPAWADSIREVNAFFGKYLGKGD
jgi:dienelactone hydrolase